MRVIVVGGGIMGLCAAWAARRAGHEVVVFDRASIPNPAGSSVDQHRLIRIPYGTSVAYARMARDAFGTWDTVWSDLGECLWAPTGTLVLKRSGDAWSSPSEHALREIGEPYGELTPQVGRDRFGHLSWSGVDGALYLASGGILFAKAIVEALARWLRSHGVTLNEHTAIVAVDTGAGAVTRADGTKEQADAVIIAAGAWLGRLVPGFAQRLTPSRQVVLYLQPPPDRLAQWQAGPMVLDLDRSPWLYFVPPRATLGLKVGDHSFTRAGNPEDARAVSEDEAKEVFEKCRPVLADFQRYEMGEAKDCFYTVEADERFIVALVDATVVISACSGHGFKFGPSIGTAVADALAGKRSATELAAWAAGSE